MAMIDDRGRVFGRINLVDAILLLLLLLAIPAAYAAYRLFRDPAPVLARINPPAIEEGSTRLVEINGEHFRPYMRISFGDQQGAAFQFYGPSQAFVPAPALPPGSYDVVLYDYMREVARLPKALTVTGPSRPSRIALRLAGAFVGLAPGQADAFIAGQPLNAAEGVIGTIETKEAPRPAITRVRVSDGLTVPVPIEGRVELPAVIRLTCPTTVAPGGVVQCTTGGVNIARDMHVSFQGPHGLVLFRIDEVRLPGEATSQP